MKKSILVSILLSAFVITGCGNPTTSSEDKPSSGEPSSQPASQQPSSVAQSSEASKAPSSSAAPSSAKGSSSSQATSSSKPTSSTPAPSSSSPASSRPTSSSTPASSSAAPSSDIPGGGNYLKKEIYVHLEPGLAKPEEGETLDPYSLTFEYDDELFLTDAKEYNPDLSMLSLGASLATATYAQVMDFFGEMFFKDLMTEDFEEVPSKDTMAHLFAHKVIDDYDLVAVDLRGFNYGLEWANNFTIGYEGNHEGFELRAKEVYSHLKWYIENRVDKTKTLKLWIDGYSRAGSVANVLASKILTGNEISITQENMYVYTFEAPAPLSEENAIAYPNVHNIMNKGDIIANIMPASYGLYRCGTEYEIYNEDVSSLMKGFDRHIDFPEFDIAEDNAMGVKNDVELRDYILNSVYNSSNTDTTVTANTREQYVNNYQTGLSNAIGYIFGLKASTRSELLATLQGYDTWAMLSIIGDQSGQALADFIKPYLNKDNIEYDEEELVSNCAVLVKAIGNLFLSLLLIYSSEQYKPLFTRLIDFHYPEVTYVLLQDAHRQQELFIEG